MSSNLTTFNGTFAQRQEYASSLKDYKILADFDGLLVAIDSNHPVNLYVSDLPNGRRTGISVTGKSYDIDGFKCIWSIHLDTLRTRLHDMCPSWYEDQLDKEGKGTIKEVLKFIKDNHPTNRGN
ncbi:hypothetical protein [Enterococcus sp.]|uniref:hypothetical protein n=1 Tax=Enterococcus sp. TaxID=35783 RepID=UPI001B73CC89|nr:hypothetical protein [Enterococcus sp.]MBP8751216.1 hypothetical protein [Enterococcus sp.]